MAEVTAAVITSSTAICLSIIPCIIKYPRKPKKQINESMEKIKQSKLKKANPGSLMYLILEDIGEYVHKQHKASKCFREYVQIKPKNIHTQMLIEDISITIAEFIQKTKKLRKKKSYTELVCLCYELVLENIMCHVQYEISDTDKIFKYANCTEGHATNIEHIRLVNQSITKTGLGINLHLIKNTKEDKARNFVIWSSSSDVFRDGDTIENQIRNPQNESLIQLSIMNRWDTNEHILETVKLTANNKDMCVFLIQNVDNRKQINAISTISNKHSSSYQANCKILVHEIYKNEHNFVIKVNSETLLIEQVIFYNDHVSELSSYITAGILNKNLHDVIHNKDSSPLNLVKSQIRRLADVMIQDTHYDLVMISVDSYIFMLCYMKYGK